MKREQSPDSVPIKKQKKDLENLAGLYLDTVNRHALDFDFERLCSISMTNINVYACLVCGKYFQGQ
jgi:U4/U6.U5 tri-snRNP-associated protein 2